MFVQLIGAPRMLIKLVNILLTLKNLACFISLARLDMKIGLGENVILDILHEDARSMMATCVDLRLVCQQLHHDASHPFRKVSSFSLVFCILY